MPTPAWINTSPTGPLLRPKEAARYIGLSRRAYEQKSAKGLLPRAQPIDGDGRATFIPKRWLDAVIEDRFTQGADQ